jgi:tryptophan synthase beta chain
MTSCRLPVRGHTQRCRAGRRLAAGCGDRKAGPHDPRRRAWHRQYCNGDPDRPSARRRREAETLLQAAINGELPDERGRFGPFGGRYVPETLVPAFERLEAGVKEHLHDPKFQAEFQRELREWVGRPTALTYAGRLSERWGADVWLKREDLAHTGAHKINNAIGQALLAKRLGVERVIAETGAGQHGVASAAACARVGLPCAVYMGAVDIERQAPNVDRMRRLGAEVIAVESGDKTGSPIPRAFITCWVPRWAHIRTLTLCVNCSR